ncbi:MarR family winged helix-turn-helix transcriptional regulator [Eubacterium multiforme]|uniref:DNA-binding MarR family transcriptional regulator n=1 Tax=Eubacterium multiforme TaxID=83339 RepID=A0ABT9UXT2_9FIRM|nr:MarR family transcriptional regulator [Eubacterium multiforme]MDQ0151059.1 DNA-binding MarR family transcriptional regulator [Eubacterium multiforme]
MDNKLKLEDQLCFKMYSISKSMIRIYGPLLKSIGLTYPQYLIMMVLWEDNKIDFKDMSFKLKMKTGTLTPIITKLESRGYLNRVKNSTDDRKIYIEITKKGSELEEKATNIPKELGCKTHLNEEEYFRYLKDFNELIAKLDYIEKYIK